MKRVLVLIVCALITVGFCPLAMAKVDTVAAWRFNERRGASVAIDSSRYHHKGVIGNGVHTGMRWSHRKGYHFRHISTSGERLKHLVRVRDSRKFDPDHHRFTVSLRLRTNQRTANVIQKGQSGMTGGYWKLEFNHGVLACMFRDGSGRTNTATSLRRINDGRWHTIKCVRTPHSVTMYVNGHRRDIHRKPTGRINNGSPLSIGGKRFCGGSVGCDYWWGDLDWIRIKK